VIVRETRGPVEVLRLEHGPVNALDLELLSALEEQLGEVERSPARAVVLTGSGRCFSAGVDLHRVLEGGADYVAAFVPRIATCFRRLFAFPKPVVAAVNGHAIAGGCVMVCACDHRVMAEESGTIGVPELLVGVSWPAWALEIVRYAVPPIRAQELVYSGRTLGADEAQRAGVVDEVVESEGLMDAALESAERLGSLPPEGFRSAKLQLRGPALDLADRLSRETDTQVIRAWSAPATAEAIRAYLDKTLGRRS
jgi:enoyl-CoA hydratase